MRDEQRETDIGPIGEPTKRAVTAIHPVNATVQKVERKEPPEPEGTLVLLEEDGRWYAPNQYLKDRAESEKIVLIHEREGCAGRVVSLGAAPSPASAEIDQLLVDLKLAIDTIDEPDVHDRCWRALSALSERLGRVTR